MHQELVQNETRRMLLPSKTLANQSFVYGAAGKSAATLVVTNNGSSFGFPWIAVKTKNKKHPVLQTLEQQLSTRLTHQVWVQHENLPASCLYQSAPTISVRLDQVVATTTRPCSS